MVLVHDQHMGHRQLIVEQLVAGQLPILIYTPTNINIREIWSQSHMNI